MRQDPTSQRLPIVIGVTGHRDLREQNEGALAAALEAIDVAYVSILLGQTEYEVGDLERGIELQNGPALAV